MSFLNSNDLSAIKGLVDPYNPENLGAASYDLCLGREVYLSPMPDTPVSERKRITLEENEDVVVPPGQFALLITEETLRIPRNCIAFISFKFGKKAMGLINVSGFHVDPGYEGKIIFATYNAGGANIHIRRGEPVFSFWLSKLTSDESRPYTKDGYSDISSKLVNNLPEQIASLTYLRDRIDELEKKIAPVETRINIFHGLVTGLLIAVFIIFLRGCVETSDNQYLREDAPAEAGSNRLQ